MNEHEFITLVEEYFDGSLSPESRTALRTEVETNQDHRRLFEEQSRQHIRIHAQTSRVDFSESQRIATVVMDIAEKHRDPNAFMELLRKRTLRERVALLIAGLRAGRNTSAHRNAMNALFRFFGPITVSVAVNIAVILMIFCLVPVIAPPPPRNEGVAITMDSASQPPDLDPIQNVATPSTPQERVIPAILTAVNDTGLTAGLHELTPQRDDGDRAFTSTDLIDLTTPAATLEPPNRVKILNALSSLENRDPTKRKGILANTIGGTVSETAVLKSLLWLKTQQSPDGSWPGQDTAAMTGLALLAYLAHGEVPGKPEYGDTVTRALKNLLARQDSSGYFSKNVYAHAIATYAIAEAFTMTRIVDLKTPLEKGVQAILDGQQTNGGFDYSYKKNNRFDTSVTGWQIQAMKAAKIAGADIPHLEEGLSRAARFLANDAFSHDGSGFVYEGKSGTPAATGGRTSMTGVGTLCLQMLGKGASPQARSGLRILHKAEFDWPIAGKAGVYSGYYVTQAKFQSGDMPDWLSWNRKMQQTLLTRQHADGHWEQGDHDSGSHVYTTTFCTLMLEVYYRYLPTYVKHPETAPQDKITSGDVPVDVR